MIYSGEMQANRAIKEKYPSLPVADLCEIFLGGTPKKSISSYWGGEIKWATAKDIANSHSRYIKHTENTITQEGLKNSAAKLLEKDTIVITARGTVGAMCMLAEPMSFNQTCYGLVAKSMVDQHYLYYALKNALNQIRSLSYGTVFDTITMKSFKNLEILLPDLSKQKAIAHILGSLDDKIELNRKMNETLEEMAKAIFKSWFVDFDPVHAKAEGRDTGLPDEISALFPDRFEGSELGQIPKGWKMLPLDQIADFLNGLALQKFPPANEPNKLPIIKIAQLRKGNTTNSDYASSNLEKKFIVEDGDVLFSWSGSLLVKIWCGGKGALNQHLFKVTSKKFPKWFYFLWSSYHLNEFINIASTKVTTMGHIQRKHLKQAMCFIPPEEVMRQIDDLFHNIVDKIIANNVEDKSLYLLRGELLPKLINGEIGMGL
ncbi:restriction endonuclease subunit S [Flexistipes sp.]|uniref:restriction endonuclease subunit S n=1 Tax=Flexistipes sp. TaxID=3088135 RepID=UPI002E1B1856|nr:restriction endonuclease subunit S [Flexistipes sp.]